MWRAVPILAVFVALAGATIALRAEAPAPPLSAPVSAVPTTLAPIARTTPAVPPSDPGPPQPAPSPAPAAPPEDDDDADGPTRVELRSAETGEPLRHVPVEVRDGQQRYTVRLATDASGVVTIPDGSCFGFRTLGYETIEWCWGGWDERYWLRRAFSIAVDLVGAPAHASVGCVPLADVGTGRERMMIDADADGPATIDGVPCGTPIVVGAWWPEAPIGMRLRHVLRTDGPATRTVRIDATDHGTIEATCRGLPPDRQVGAVLEWHHEGIVTTVARAHLDANGRARFDRVMSGVYRLRVEHHFLVGTTCTMPVTVRVTRDAATRVTIDGHLPVAPITGIVRDRDGRPCARDVQYAIPGPFLSRAVLTRSGPDGFFRTKPLPVRAHRVAAWFPNWTTVVPGRPVVLTEGPGHVEIVVPVAGLDGVATDATVVSRSERRCFASAHAGKVSHRHPRDRLPDVFTFCVVAGNRVGVLRDCRIDAPSDTDRVDVRARITLARGGHLALPGATAPATRITVTRCGDARPTTVCELYGRPRAIVLPPGDYVAHDDEGRERGRATVCVGGFTALRTANR